MSTRTIKVIKRDERNQQSTKEIVSQAAVKNGRTAAREMVATVSTWVNDFQQKRRTETKRAFESLFVDPAPQPTEV